MAVSSPPIDTTVPAQTWVTLTSGGIQVSSALTVPNVTYLSSGGGQNGLVGGGDGQAIYLIGTANKLDGGQQWLIWDATSVTPANGTTVFNPWVVTGTPGRWRTATIASLPGLQQNGVVYSDGTTLRTNTGFTYNITQVAISGRLLVSRNTAVTLPDLDTQSPTRIVGLDGASNYVWMYGAGTPISTGLFGQTARGTIAAPTATQDGDILVTFAGGGYGTTQWKQGAGACYVAAVGNWSDTQQGTEFVVATTTIATASPYINRTKVRQGLMVLAAGNVLPTGGDPGQGSINLAGTLQFNGVDIKGNVPATATNNNAAAGTVGETVRGTNAGVPLTTAVSADIATVALTAGDWDVWGVVHFVPAATTTPTALAVSTGTVANTFAGYDDDSASAIAAAFATNQQHVLQAGMKRYSLAAPTTVRLVANSTFGTNTMTANGVINARRRR